MSAVLITGMSGRRRQPYQDRLDAHGAIVIDASQPLHQVVDAILSHTLPSAAAGRAAAPGP